MVVTDHYETLGVPYNAPLKDINSAYKRLALKHHPDKAGGGDIDDFQKIQQAAETLRDPIRRRRHDHELRVHRVKRQQGPGPAPGSSGTGSGSGFYSRWMPSSVGSYNMGTSGYRYMYSYGNSVHMNPDSQDSVDERERIARERKLDEEIRQRKSSHHHGPSPSSSNEKESERTAPKHREKSRERFEDKSWEARRQEAMKARVVRDEKELKDEGGQGESKHGKGEHAEKEQEGDDRIPGAFEEEEAHEEEPDAKDGCDSTDDQNEQESEDGDEDEDDDAQSTSEYGTAQESEISDSIAEDDGPTEEEDMTIFYDCKQSHLPYNANTAASQDESGSESDTSEEDEEEEEEEDDEEEGKQQKDSNSTNTNETPPSLLSPFIPYLNAKLNDPSGKYTKEDLHVELHGIVMETYCGWLESLRVTFPDAKPTSTSENEQQQQGCLHLGYWEKTFGCPECEVCHRWKPIYVLTCRGCGIKACVGCKFQGENRA